MELRSRSLPPPAERRNQSESPAQRSRPPSHTDAFGFNPFMDPSPDEHRRGPASPSRSILNSPDPLEDRNLRGWTNFNMEKTGMQPSDFEDNLRGYLEDSPFDRLPADRRWQPDRERSFRPIPQRQESQTFQEQPWQPLIDHPRPIKNSQSWENDYRHGPTLRPVAQEPSYSRDRMDRSSSPFIQDQRPFDYDRLRPDSSPRQAREPASLALTRGRPEQRFEQMDAWRPQRQLNYTGQDRVIIQNDFKPRPPSFDGKPDTWEPFLMQLKLMAKSYRWSDRKFREQLMFALRGEALLFASNLPHITVEDTDSLLQVMGQRFGQCLLAETHRANLYNLKKQSKENLQQYSARVSRLMSRAYPGMQGTPVFENLAIEHLLRGLPDQKLAYEILTKKPRDLSEAIDMITWHEACRQYTTKTSGLRNVQYQNSDDEDYEYDQDSDSENTSSDVRRINGKRMVTEERVNQLWRDMQKYMSEQLEKIVGVNSEESDKRYGMTNKKRDSQPICFYCNKEGHIAPNCPKKQAERSQKQKNQGNDSGLC